MTETKTLEIYRQLHNSVPSIGFLSRKKRILAYIDITKRLQSLLDDNEIKEDDALFILSMLMRKHKNFQKAGMMTALSLASIGKAALSPIGYKYATEMRTNMKLSPIDDDNSVEI